MWSIAFFILLLIALTPPLGAYLYRVYTSEKNGRIEGSIYRLLGVDPSVDQSWQRYALAMLLVSGVSTVFVYLLMRVQGSLPFNPVHLGGVDPIVAFNTAASFTSNTNWQAYGGETTMSYLSQMLGMTFQNYLSAGVGMAVLVAFIRGFTCRDSAGVGNFWRDLVRTIFYVLLPLSIVMGTALVLLGVTQTLAGSAHVTGLQGFEQVIARGPVASQEAIKMLGTNGGGFFNANSAHPFENPTPLTGFIELLSILLIPAALTSMFGRMVGRKREGWMIFTVMGVLLLAGLAVIVPQERHASFAMQHAGVPASQPNMEGKETRYSTDEASLWAGATTAASNGSVDSMHDSFNPLSGVPMLFNIASGEVIFGGVGSGLHSMLLYAVLAVFIGGLMVGRTPEYLGKKIGAREVKLSVIGLFVPILLMLTFAAVAVVIPQGLDARLNPGPHGFSEILYAFASMSGNNGSAFAGLTASGPFYAISGGIVMLLARFVPLVAGLALAGGLARAGSVPQTAGTLRTDTPLFGGLLGGVVVIIGALSFFPALALGPIVEQLAKGH